MYKLTEKVLHQVQHTDRGHFVTRHLDEVVPDLGFGGVEVASLDKYFLLFCDGVLE